MKREKKPKALWTQFAAPVRGPENFRKHDRPTRVRSVSWSLAGRVREYAKARKAFVAGKRCAVFPDLPAEEVHHSRGRFGALLLDERYWVAVSRDGHRWIHANVTEARERGWICAKGDWGRA